jgi:class 3 adenylate cyclase
MEQNYAIMFADIAGSTSLYDALGNQEADRQIRYCIDTLTSLTNKHRGTLIKTIGDEIMARFNSANDAIDAAIDMQNTISGDDSNRLLIRVGVEFGPAILREGDLFGDAVNVAARMAAVAKDRQIITTRHCVDQLSDDRKSITRHFDQARVKGKEQELSIYQVNWEAEGKVTKFATSNEMRKISKSMLALVLKYGDNEKLVTDQEMASAFSVGRDASCDVSIDTDYASRSHVDIKLSRGKFVVCDHSTNGTYVRFKGQDDLFIRREELPLMGEGYISLGEEVREDNPAIISFSVLQAGK